LNPERTHRLLVSAYILRGEAFLLLHRRKAPVLWMPPGGHLEVDEDPIRGVLREVGEETALEVDVLAPSNTWFGNLRERPALSIDFLCRYRSGEVRLSDEHDEFCWSTLEQLRSGRPDLGNDPLSFTLAHFEQAYRISKMFP